MRSRVAVAAGRAARTLARLRGGGSAVPGRVALAIQPRFLERAFGDLPDGLVFVTGSNGKSTTTNMVTGILREHGLEVFTNPAGGNLPQGIASALLADVPADGRVRADVAVLEVDEAYGVALARALSPRGTLLLNIQVDQLNRFHEPQRVVGMLRSIAADTTGYLVVNADDPNVQSIAVGRDDVTAFAVDAHVIAAAPHGLSNAEAVETGDEGGSTDPTVVVTELHGREAVVTVGDADVAVALPARGVHYAVDAAGAVALAVRILGDRFDPAAAGRAFTSLRTVYGRGEILTVGGEEIEIVMMKNPPSLQLNLDALPEPPEQVLLAVDEGTPDPSWFYGTDLGSLDHVDVVTGTKAWQLATRLAYAELPVGLVQPDLRTAVRTFLERPAPERGHKTMIVNYEQMMRIRKDLGFVDLEGAS